MILLVCAVFPPEPVVSASIANDIATALSENRKVIVLTPRASRPSGYKFDNEIAGNGKFERIVLDSFICPESKLFGRMWESYSFGKHVVTYIKANHSNIQGVFIKAWPMFSQFLIVRISQKYSIPSIVHVQDIYPESLTNKFRFFGSIINLILKQLDIYILINATRIIAISDNMASTFMKTRGIAVDKIEIVPNWHDESNFSSNTGKSSADNKIEFEKDQFVFMFLGNIGPVAGVDLLIESFVEANITGAKLVIAGAGSNKNKCVELAKNYKNASIEFWDVPFGKVPDIQEKATVMLLPLKKGAAMSSVPSKLPAYMFSKKPVIACLDEQSDTALAIKSANCGWILPPDNINVLAKTMIDVVSLDHSLLIKYGLNGFNYAIKNYSKKNNLEKILTIINQTI
jgi:glycosyltransferase involved in cell wall biosynthesis